MKDKLPKRDMVRAYFHICVTLVAFIIATIGLFTSSPYWLGFGTGTMLGIAVMAISKKLEEK